MGLMCDTWLAWGSTFDRPEWHNCAIDRRTGMGRRTVFFLLMIAWTLCLEHILFKDVVGKLGKLVKRIFLD
jgi:hypothetical protein